MRGLVLASVLALVACTKAQAVQVVDGAGAVCPFVLQFADPALAPFCATAEEIALAIIALDTAGAKMGGPMTPHTTEAIAAEIVKMRAAKGKK